MAPKKAVPKPAAAPEEHVPVHNETLQLEEPTQEVDVLEDEVPDGVPAAFLMPTWELRHMPKLETDFGQLFDVSSSGFTLCARVRGSFGSTVRILRMCDSSQSWALVAPSATGRIAFGGDHATEPLSTSPPAKDKSSESETVDLGQSRIDDGDWHHVAVTWHCGKSRAYVDGKLDGSLKMDVNPVPACNLLGGGAGRDVTMVQAFSMALSTAQIAELAVGELPTGVQIPLRPHDVRELQRLQDCTSGGLSPRAFLADCFGLGPASSFQSDVLCDYLVDLLHHARTLCLSLRQMSVLTGIMWSVFAAMHRRSESSAPRVGESFTPAECYAEYRRLLLAHCGRHGTSEKPHMTIFSVLEAKQISAYVSSSLFNHFILYKYCLVAHQAKTTFCNLTLDFPRPPPDLRSGKLLVEQVSETPPISEVGSGADEALESLTHAEVEREPLQDDTLETEPHADLDAFVAQSVYESEQRLLESIARRDEQLSEGRDKLAKGKG